MQTIEYYFQDVANQKAVRSKKQYLPLTRRIERGRYLQEIIQIKDESALFKLKQDLNDHIVQFLNLWKIYPLDDFIKIASNEAEYFLDNTSTELPICVEKALQVDHTLTKQSEEEQLLWQIFYLLSLFPSENRLTWEETIYTDDVKNHFNRIVQEYTRSKQQLIKGTLRYPIRIARKYVNQRINYLDLVQEGNIGLMLAVDRFQESKGAHFQQYATTWIRQRITRYIADASRLIRIPAYQHDTSEKISREIRKLQSKLERKPTHTELAVTMGWIEIDDLEILRKYQAHRKYKHAKSILDKHSDRLFRTRSYSSLSSSRLIYDQLLLTHPREFVSLLIAINELALEQVSKENELSFFEHIGWLTQTDVEILRNNYPSKITENQFSRAVSRLNRSKVKMAYHEMANAVHFSIEQTICLYKDSTKAYWEELLIDQTQVEDIAVSNLAGKRIRSLLNMLNPREKEIIELRFGLVNGPERTLEEIGKLFKLTRERIRQIESRAIGKLTSRYSHIAVDNLKEINSTKHYEVHKNDVIRMLRDLPIYKHNNYKIDIDRLDNLIREYLSRKNNSKQAHLPLAGTKQDEEKSMATNNNIDDFVDDVNGNNESKQDETLQNQLLQLLGLADPHSERDFVTTEPSSTLSQKPLFNDTNLPHTESILDETRKLIITVLQEYGKPLHYYDIGKYTRKTHAEINNGLIYLTLTHFDDFQRFEYGYFGLSSWNKN